MLIENFFYDIFNEFTLYLCLFYCFFSSNSSIPYLNFWKFESFSDDFEWLAANLRSLLGSLEE